MALITQPSLPIVDFRMAWQDDSEIVPNPYSGTELDLTHGNPGRWAGTIAWATGAAASTRGSLLDAQRANERQIQAVLMALQGRRNRMDLTLPGAPLYAHQSALPAGATATVSGVAAGPGGVNLTLALSGAGTAVLAPGNVIRYADRSYVLTALNGPVATVVPEIVPPPGGTAIVAGVYIPIRIDGTRLLQRRSGGLVQPVHEFQWSEVL